MILCWWADSSLVTTNFRELEMKCKNASGDTYIKSLQSGTNVSAENLSKGFTHVVSFNSASDVVGIRCDFRIKSR
jgi:hypothetical protein